MSKIDYQKLREISEKTKIAGEAPVMPFDQRINALNDFMKHFSPDIALALLDEIEAKDRRITELEAREVQLPTRYDLRYGHPINADKRHVMIPKENGSWLCLIDLEHALRVAGIRIKGDAGEQNDEKP